MEIAATANPVTCVMEACRSLILEGFNTTALLRGFVVVAVGMAIMLDLSVRRINHYD